MSASHLSSDATTVFEALEDAGLVTGAINFTCYRGRHAPRDPAAGASRAVTAGTSRSTARSRFFFFNLYESDATGAPLADPLADRAARVDRYAVTVGRWLVTRDGFDFLVYYLPDYDYASHARGPDGAQRALERADAALRELDRRPPEASRSSSSATRSSSAPTTGRRGCRQVVSSRRASPTSSLLAPRRPRPERRDVAVVRVEPGGDGLPAAGRALTSAELAERLDGEPAVDVVSVPRGRGGGRPA